MNARRIYLDYNAGAPLRPVAAAAMAAAIDRLGAGGNPSSIHGEGRAVRDVVERARDAVARLAGALREQVVFTSGGSEANSLGIHALLAGRRDATLVVSRTEHPAVTGLAEARAAAGGLVRWIDVAPDGRWRLDQLTGLGPDTVAAISAVNHETGVIQPVGDVAAQIRAGGGRVLVDAVQAAGKLALGPLHAAVDALVLSAHKLGGPAGVGALVLGARFDITNGPMVAGTQERGRRGGTENVVGIAGFGAAATASDLATWPAIARLGDELEAGLRALGAEIAGDGAPRVGGTINARFAGVPGDAIVMGLDLAGVAASVGAACSSGSLKASPVLRAMGRTDDEAREAVRLSLGWGSHADDPAAVLARLAPVLAQCRAV